MDMWMMFEFLIPRMQHTEEANVCPQMPWVACNLEQCLSTDPKKQIVDYPLVLQSERAALAHGAE
jgi:hypothetical protein